MESTNDKLVVFGAGVVVGLAAAAVWMSRNTAASDVNINPSTDPTTTTAPHQHPYTPAVHVPAAKLVVFGKQLLVAHGASAEVAVDVAEACVVASSRG
jgi:hypothetical protein